MKHATLALVGIALVISSTFTFTLAQDKEKAQEKAPAKSESTSDLKTVEQKFAYAVGVSMGRQMKGRGLELDPQMIAKGIKDALADKPELTDEQMMEVQQAFEQVMQAKQVAQGEKTLKEGQAFLAANKTKPGVKELPSGVQYKVIKSGPAGGKSPKATDTVSANYRGTLIDGTEFDSSKESGGPVPFTVNRVIKGWTEILQLMKPGDKWQVFIPSELAYGANPRPGGKIRPNDALIFDIELVEVK